MVYHFYKLSLFYVLVIIVALCYHESKGKRRKMMIIAHRGASAYAPENTFAAFDKAVELHADFLELDVQMNRDRELVVIHDTTLDRTTDATGPVKQVTNKALRYIDAGSWFDRAFYRERIPKLTDVLDRYSGKIGLLLELKNPSLYPGIEKKLAKLLKKYHHKQTKQAPFIVQSFEHQSIQTFHKLLPSILTAVLIRFDASMNLFDMKSFSSYANGINPYFSTIDENLIDMARRFGMNVFAWTVNDRAIAQYLESIGVDGIVTNYPDLMG